MNKIVFDAIIEQHGDINAAYIKFPFNVNEIFGTNAQVKVIVVFDGKIEYRGSLANMGAGCHTLGITKEIRKNLNKSFGDIVHVELEKDQTERVVVIPSDVLVKLEKNKQAYQFYNSLSYTDRKEYIQWIITAKKEETRIKRIETLIEKLNLKKRYSDK